MVRVLFIDDDPRAQSTLAMVLDGRYTVLSAASAAEGLRLLREQDPDVVLLGIDLPDRDGLSLLEDIVAGPAAPPVIMLTGSDSDTRSADPDQSPQVTPPRPRNTKVLLFSEAGTQHRQ